MVEMGRIDPSTMNIVYTLSTGAMIVGMITNNSGLALAGLVGGTAVDCYDRSFDQNVVRFITRYVKN